MKNIVALGLEVAWAVELLEVEMTEEDLVVIVVLRLEVG